MVRRSLSQSPAFLALTAVPMAVVGQAAPRDIIAAPHPQVLWDGDRLVRSAFPGSRMKVSRGGTSATIEAPAGSIGVSMRKGVASALRLDGGRIFLARRMPDGTWTDHPTTLDRPGAEGDLKGLPLTLNETGSDQRFFATNFILGFQHHGEVSPVSRWKLDQATGLKPEGLVPLELDGPVFLPRKGARNGALMDLAPGQAGLAPFLDHPVRVEGASIIVSLGSGVLWVVKDGSKRAGPVIRLTPPGPRCLEGCDLRPPAIHGLLPLPGGRVIIALRPSSPAQVGPRSTEPVIWKVVNPMTGAVADPSADLLRDAPRTLASGHRLSFSVDPGGRLRIQQTSVPHPSGCGQRLPDHTGQPPINPATPKESP